MFAFNSLSPTAGKTFSFCILSLSTHSWQVDWFNSNEIKFDIHPRFISTLIIDPFYINRYSASQVIGEPNFHETHDRAHMWRQEFNSSKEPFLQVRCKYNFIAF